MSNSKDLAPGSKFRASEGLVWEIDRVCDTTSPIPHVKMVGVDDPSAIKVIAQSVLMDQRRFQAV